MNKMRCVAIIMLVIAIFCSAFATADAGVSDKALAKRWAQKHYPGYKVVFVKDASPVISHRAGKHKVYIEVIHTRSAGGYDGWTKDGYYVCYTKKVRKGKRATSYAIWNPHNNVCDDVVAFVDHGKIRR